MINISNKVIPVERQQWQRITVIATDLHQKKSKICLLHVKFRKKVVQSFGNEKKRKNIYQ